MRKEGIPNGFIQVTFFRAYPKAPLSIEPVKYDDLCVVLIVILM